MSPHRAAQRRAKIVKLTAAGKSGSEIALIMGISRQRVSQLRAEEHLVLAEGPHVARRAAIPGLIRQGMCGADIARHFGCHPDCIRDDMRTLVLSPALHLKLLANRSRAMSEAKINAAAERRASKATKHKALPAKTNKPAKRRS